MATWIVYQPPAETLDAAAQRTVFVKDGVSLGALAIPALWLLYRRMWLVFLGWLAAAIAVALLASSLGPLAAALPVLFALGFALEANGLRGWTLERKGYRVVGIVNADTRSDAELRHFARPGDFVLPPFDSHRRPVVTAAIDPDAVIGFFPTAGGRP